MKNVLLENKWISANIFKYEEILKILKIINRKTLDDIHKYRSTFMVDSCALIYSIPFIGTVSSIPLKCVKLHME